jgi:hypothetical protein
MTIAEFKKQYAPDTKCVENKETHLASYYVPLNYFNEKSTQLLIKTLPVLHFTLNASSKSIIHRFYTGTSTVDCVLCLQGETIIEFYKNHPESEKKVYFEDFYNKNF